MKMSHDIWLIRWGVRTLRVLQKVSRNRKKRQRQNTRTAPANSPSLSQSCRSWGSDSNIEHGRLVPGQSSRESCSVYSEEHGRAAIWVHIPKKGYLQRYQKHFMRIFDRDSPRSLWTIYRRTFFDNRLLSASTWLRIGYQMAKNWV